MKKENFKYKSLTKKEQKIYQNLISKLSTWLKQKVASSFSSGITLGISGGVDSATLACLCSRIFAENAYFYYFKTGEDLVTENHVKKLEKTLNHKIKIIELTESFDKLTKDLKVKNKKVIANLKSRFFMASLYAKSQEKNTLVLGTDNFDEYFLGYFTKYGDGGCDLLPFANLKKSEVYVLANLLSVPKEIIEKHPSANLYKKQYDEIELGFTYEEFEKWKLDKNLVSNKTSERIEYLHKISNHKRELIPKGPKLK
ncbi:NAD+ synthase [Metamycoplasma subdolum]|uniref:NH(3)-dependent NAD(+) synthetase n=1 Tax=Metamycoplasma subdolum TaxID=92407 RepID=A0A3M0A1Y3_9BACT|nr:NAD(+) synthase [Metamycoplasma subdolum]RMA78636.1 NAD+ synthase [Metamycoplasma subdolum]WPB50762.1 NAD(+) synthase [Metamycoplasma subdolum]